MSSHFRWGFIIVLGLILSDLLAGSTRVVGKVNPGAYRIERILLANVPPEGFPEEREWRNILCFSNSNIRVPLARSTTNQYESYGFDPATLKLKWLKRDELLLISWRTFRLGSGGYLHDGNVLLQIHEGKTSEIFRDYFESMVRWGMMAGSIVSLEISYDDKNQIVTFKRRDEQENSGPGKPPSPSAYPLMTTFTIGGETEVNWISDVITVDTWHYKFTGGKLKFLDGYSALDLGDDSWTLKEIGKDFKLSRKALELMNPRLQGKNNAKGIVVIDKKIKPYKTWAIDDGFGGEKSLE